MSEETLVATVDQEALEIYLEEIGENVTAVNDGTFRIQDMDSANWVVKRFNDWDMEEEALDAYYRKRKKQLQALKAWWLRRFADDLVKFAIQELAKRGGKGRTLHLFSGKLALRRKPPKLEFVEGWEPKVGNPLFDEFREWCAVNEVDAVQTRFEVLKTPLNEYVFGVVEKGEVLKEGTGEIPPGMRIVPENANELYIQR